MEKLNNRRELITNLPIDLSYIAGLFDGEGCVNIEKNKASDMLSGFRYQLKTTIQIREAWILEELKNIFGGSLIYYKDSFEKHSPTGRWRLTDKKAGLFLKIILPYLRLKKEQAIVGIEFRKSKESFKHGYAKKISIEQEEIQVRCYNIMRELNAHGKNRLEYKF